MQYKGFRGGNVAVGVTTLCGIPIKDAIEIIEAYKQKRVLVPPVEIGATVYTIAGRRKNPKEWKVIGYWFCEESFYNYAHITHYKDGKPWESRHVSFTAFGETIYLSKAEAEKALSNLQANYKQVKGGAE